MLTFSSLTYHVSPPSSSGILQHNMWFISTPSLPRTSLTSQFSTLSDMITAPCQMPHWVVPRHLHHHDVFCWDVWLDHKQVPDDQVALVYAQDQSCQACPVDEDHSSALSQGPCHDFYSFPSVFFLKSSRCSHSLCSNHDIFSSFKPLIFYLLPYCFTLYLIF